MPYDIKVLFKKNDEKVEIPNLIEVGGDFIPITYRGCQPICSFCKKSRHWKSECSIISGSKKQILKPEPKAQGKPNEFAKNLVKNKPNKFQSNGAVKQMQDRINNFLGNSKNQQKNNGWAKYEIAQDETQIAIKLESTGNNNGLFTSSDLSSNLSYPSSPVAIDMIEPEPNKDNSVGRINIRLIEQMCEQQKNTDIKMDEH
ncbi:hypothetical protein BB561_002340 [Smittium simulii]|uniref:Uncharacterized protein n=1 Tax=Smittium simulii TaxID=133385 RepID=A0A2T9YQU6_9FUNG|nr:hypothetical protein BB561_002340 [Smittium simulii]